MGFDRQKQRAVFGFLLSALLLGFQLIAADAACCYFAAKDKDISQPGQIAFIAWNPQKQTEAFTVQPKFEGNAVDFGMVIPTPSRPKLDEMPRDLFKGLALFTILLPLPQPIYSPLDPQIKYKSDNARRRYSESNEQCKERTVVVLEQGVVGSLDYKIIVATNSNDLFDWLKANKYSYGGDEKTLQHYINKKWFFTVMKIDPKQMKKSSDGRYQGDVTPTRFTFESKTCIYPLKITQISVKDRSDALFYVQAPQQMDLPGDWSWMHSYRPMYLNYMLGCGMDRDQSKELNERSQWLNNKLSRDGRYETTKLEWAKRLSQQDISVLEDPRKNYGGAGGGDLPPGSKVISLPTLLAELKSAYAKVKSMSQKQIDDQMVRLEDQYQPSKGAIVQNDPKNIGKGFIMNHFSWYPAREVPQDELKTVTLLKGHLQNGQWLTKFRKLIRKDEMTDDLLLADVPAERNQTYVRVMPTSPP